MDVNAKAINTICHHLQIRSSDDCQAIVCNQLDRLELECTVGISDCLDLIKKFRAVTFTNLAATQTLDKLQSELQVLKGNLLATMEKRTPEFYSC